MCDKCYLAYYTATKCHVRWNESRGVLRIRLTYRASVEPAFDITLCDMQGRPHSDRIATAPFLTLCGNVPVGASPARAMRRHLQIEFKSFREIHCRNCLQELFAAMRKATGSIAAESASQCAKLVRSPSL